MEGMADTKIHAPPHTCYHVNLVVLRQRMYTKVDKTHSAVWIQYTNVTDRQTTDGQTPGDTKDRAYT